MDFDWQRFDEAERAGKIVFCCAPTSVKYDFPLEVVAVDEDGRIAPRSALEDGTPSNQRS
jgi:hypothetical protein